MIVISFLVGYEVYGVGGSVVSMSVAVFVTAVLDAIAEEDRDIDAIEAPAATPA